MDRPQAWPRRRVEPGLGYVTIYCMHGISAIVLKSDYESTGFAYRFICNVMSSVDLKLPSAEHVQYQPRSRGHS